MAVVVPVVVPAPVPAMIVVELAVIAIPVALIVALSIMARFHPMCAGIRRTGPVSVMPPIAVAHWVPVTTHPKIAGSGTSWLYPDYTNRWRRADSYPKGKLGETSSRRQKR